MGRELEPDPVKLSPIAIQFPITVDIVSQTLPPHHHRLSSSSPTSSSSSLPTMATPVMTFPMSENPLPKDVNWNQLSIELPGTKRKGQTGNVNIIIISLSSRATRRSTFFFVCALGIHRNGQFSFPVTLCSISACSMIAPGP